MTRRSPIEALIDRSGLRCTICGAQAGACDCWVTCQCGHSYQRGTECRNSVHTVEQAVADLAGDVGLSVVRRMKELYPTQMSHRGFRTTLQGEIIQAARETLLIVFDARRDAEAANQARLPGERRMGE